MKKISFTSSDKLVDKVWRLERGNSSITLSTMGRVFKALGIATATLDLGIAGKIALW